MKIEFHVFREIPLPNGKVPLHCSILKCEITILFRAVQGLTRPTRFIPVCVYIEKLETQLWDI